MLLINLNIQIYLVDFENVVQNLLNLQYFIHYLNRFLKHLQINSIQF